MNIKFYSYMENLSKKNNKIYSKTFQELEKAFKGLKQRSY